MIKFVETKKIWKDFQCRNLSPTSMVKMKRVLKQQGQQRGRKIKPKTKGSTWLRLLMVLNI